ncbi:helix-turn-helix domain-containing protein [Sphaerisporangium fuscum]|uniref:helix-turn-helix domain-containing protein n=1 Tax=Sphaerisporangium fuscum TaxID=2835868 RepID=UPI001BDBFC51|nr:helix-turn-helix domain-containing protein [Sphaerisporangium fuscum]
MLEAIGLSPAESRLYATLVENPRSSAAELAMYCGVSTPLAARALALFARRGLASRLPGRRARYVAVSPDIAIQPMLSRREEELHQVRAAIRELTTTYHRASRSTTHPAEQVEVVTGSENIISRAYALQDSAQRTFRNIEKPPYVMPSFMSNVDREHRMLRAGVDYRSLYDVESLTPAEKLDQIRIACALGEQARVVTDAPLKLWIADEALALIPIRNGNYPIDTAFVLHPSALLDALIALFELEWRRGFPLRTAMRPGGPFRGGAGRAAEAAAGPSEAAAPDELTRRLLALLAAGHTDEGIARALGLGLRTVQRRIHDLMRELNAITRFQAGMAARERGWV